MATKLIGYQVHIQECVYCKLPQDRVFYITPAQYEESKGAYDAQWHQCTSGNSILGGGPCCDAIGHWVTPMYKEEDEKEEDYTMCKYCGYPDDHCKCGCAYYD